MTHRGNVQKRNGDILTIGQLLLVLCIGVPALICLGFILFR